MARTFALCRVARVPIVPFGGGSGVCGGVRRARAASCSRPGGSTGSSSSTTRTYARPSGPARTAWRRSARCRERAHDRPLAAVDRALDGRRLGGDPRRGPVLDGLRQHRGRPARPRGRAPGRERRAHAPHAAGLGGAGSAPALPRQRGHARRRDRGDVLAARAAGGVPRGRPSTSRASRRASRRFAGSCARAGGRRSCGSTTRRSRPELLGLLPRGPRAADPAARGRRPRSSRRARRRGLRSAEAGGVETDAAVVDQWLEHRNHVPGFRGFLEKGIVLDTIEVGCTWERVAPLYERVTASLREVPGLLARERALEPQLPLGHEPLLHLRRASRAPRAHGRHLPRVLATHDGGDPRRWRGHRAPPRHRPRAARRPRRRARPGRRGAAARR